MNKTKHIIAIDPGMSGGVAFSNGNESEAEAMNDDAYMRDLIEEVAKRPGIVCYLEQVGGYIAGNPAPGSAMFNFGDGYGYIRGCLAMARIKTVLVRPQVWQKGIPGLIPKMRPVLRKRALKEHAARLFPDLTPTLKTADALCILAYAQRIEAGERPVEIPDRSDFKRDAKAAKKWALAHGFEVPARNSREFLDMVNYYKKQNA